MARVVSRWPTVTGLWLLAPAWVYAALASLERRDLNDDPTGRRSFAAGTAAAAVLVLLGLLFGIPEVRRGYR